MEQNIGNGIKSRYDLEKGKIHREHISIAQGCTKQVNTGRNTVAQERIAELIPGSGNGNLAELPENSGADTGLLDKETGSR